MIDRYSYQLSFDATTKGVLDKSPFTVYHMPLKTIPVSSTLIRQQLKDQVTMPNYLSRDVYDYIRENKLYLE